MFKLISTLIRGQIHTAEDALRERHALPVLAQQIREASRGVDAARKAVAIAMAGDRQEGEHVTALNARITDLETRAVAALQSGQDDLAREAAQAIALIEGERDTALAARAEFADAITRLKGEVRRAEMRLLALNRGERIALAKDRTQRMVRDVPGRNLATLDDAEATLEALEKRQRGSDLVAEALAELDPAKRPEQLLARLADAGCGPAQGVTADTVLARLRARAADPAKNDPRN